MQIILKKQDKPFKFSVLDILIMGFFIYLSTNMLFNIDKYGLPNRYIELAGLAALFLVLRTLETKHFKLLFLAILISGIAQAIYGNLQLYGIFPSRHNLFNITGGFFNPGPYAAYLSVIFPVAMAIYFATSGNKNETKANGFKVKLYKNIELSERLVIQYISIIALVAIILVLPSTRSRAAWLAVIASSAVILIKRYKVLQFIKKLTNSLFKKTVFISVLLIISGLSVFGLYSMKKGSSDGRLLIWKVTTNMIAQNPLFGYGYDRFKANYLNFQADYFSKTGTESEAIVADNSTRAFNEYMQLSAESGIIGLLLVLAIFGSLFFGKYKTRTNNKPLLLAAKMSILSFAVFAFFSYPTEILPVKLVVTICLAFIAPSQKNIGLNKFNIVMQVKAVKPILFAASSAVLLSTILLILPLKERYKIHKKWKQAFTTYQMGLYEDCFDEYAEIYKTLKYNGAYLVNYGKACSISGKHQKAVKVLSRAEKFIPNTIVYTTLGDSYKALGRVGKAEQAYKKAALMLPDRFYPKYLLAKLYIETGQNQKAVNTASELLNKKVKIQSTAIEEIKAEMRKIIEGNETVPDFRDGSIRP